VKASYVTTRYVQAVHTHPRATCSFGSSQSKEEGEPPAQGGAGRRAYHLSGVDTATKFKCAF
jgi:hypothetical protein